MKTLLLDNYDSFTHILFQYLWEVNGEKPLLLRNDEWSLEEIRRASFDAIVISPGPGHPADARDFGVCAQVIAAFPDRPILGVCLGLQGLGLAAGGRVVPAPAVRHGKHSRIRHDGEGLFAGLPQNFSAVRYHSLVLDPHRLPAGLIVAATALDDGQIMAIRSSDKPFHGVQFHPESIGSEHGKALLANFRALSERFLAARGSPIYEPPTAALPIPPRSQPAPRRLEAVELPWCDPEAAFAHFFNRDPKSAGLPATFWLDSLSEPVPGEHRITYMGAGSRLIEVRGGTIRMRDAAGTGGLPTGESISAPLLSAAGADSHPFPALDGWFRAAVPCRLPETLAFTGSFLGGLVGWFGYELGRFSEGDGGSTAPPGAAGPSAHPDADLPDALFLQPDRMLAFDPQARKAYAILPLGPSQAKPDASARAWLQTVRSGWDAVPPSELRIARRSSGEDAALGASANAPQTHAPAGPATRLPWRLSAAGPEYLARIRSLQEAILRGESYEACLTNELRAESQARPFEVYRRLRRTNPAPYAAYLAFPHADILSASPERFLKLDALGNLACRPIKGTRRRGTDRREDALLKSELAGDAKDRSENLMIVDLVRNDFGKVCELGSVRVPEMMKVEEHPTVLQLVSTVTGRLARDRTALDAVRACFPGGSMTGAPKRRTMELLAAQERRPRGIFSGALGYLGWDGAMDLGMVIRTLVYKDGVYRVGCGGAILAESDPEAEFAEAMLKASASLIAVELAEFGAAGNWQTVS